MSVTIDDILNAANEMCEEYAEEYHTDKISVGDFIRGVKAVTKWRNELIEAIS